MEVPDFKNIEAWKLFFKRFYPVVLYAIKNNAKKLIAVFLLSFGLYWYFINPYSKEYTILVVPKEENTDISRLSDWTDWLEEYFNSIPDFKTNVFDNVFYSFQKEKFSIIINASFHNKNFAKLVDQRIGALVNNFRKKNVAIFSINLTSKSVILNGNNLVYGLTFSTCLFFFMLIFLLLYYAFSDRIFEVKQLKSRSYQILGIIPRADQDFFYHRPRSHFAEALRNVYSSLREVSLGDDKKTLLITSSVSGEGKSTVSLNLGMVASSFGKKAVVIECDLRKPKIHQRLNLENSIGLSAYLIKKAQIKDILLPVPECKNLFIIPSGPIPPNPTELLENGRLLECLKELKAEGFDIIIIDSAPSLVADASFMAKLSDLILTITRINYSSLENTDETYKKMKKLNNDTYLLINCAGPIELFSYGYGYSYGGYYNYYDETPQNFTSRMRKLFDRKA